MKKTWKMLLVGLLIVSAMGCKRTHDKKLVRDMDGNLLYIRSGIGETYFIDEVEMTVVKGRVDSAIIWKTRR